MACESGNSSISVRSSTNLTSSSASQAAEKVLQHEPDLKHCTSSSAPQTDEKEFQHEPHLKQCTSSSAIQADEKEFQHQPDLKEMAKPNLKSAESKQEPDLKLDLEPYADRTRSRGRKDADEQQQNPMLPKGEGKKTNPWALGGRNPGTPNPALIDVSEYTPPMSMSRPAAWDL